MNILQVIPSTDPRGGGPIEAVRQISLILEGMGHRIEVVSTDAPDASWLPDFPFKSHALGPGSTSFAYVPQMVPWLKANAGRFDAVVVNGLWQYPSLAVWQALRRTSTPYFVYTHGMLDPWFNRMYPMKHLKKRLYWPWGEYRVLRDAKAVLFTCEEEKLLARQSFRRYSANEIVVSLGTSAPNGDPLWQKETFLTLYPEMRGKRLLLFLGRIHPKKGCDLLIEAFAQVASLDSELSLVMAGPDQAGWQADLERLALARGVGDRILWPGMLAGDIKWGAFHASEAFVLPSHQENFGIAVAEALACGRPVLISNKVNIWREISEAGAGLVAVDDVEGTRQMLNQWIYMDAQAKAEMGYRAVQCFLQHFEINHAAQGLIMALAPSVLRKGPERIEGVPLC